MLGGPKTISAAEALAQSPVFNQIFYNTTIQINRLENGGLNIVVETPSLIMRSVTADDVDIFNALFSDPQVMSKYDDGQTRAHKGSQSESDGQEDFADHVINNPESGYVQEWLTGNPFSWMVGISRETGAKIGALSLEKEINLENSFGFCGLLLPEHQGKKLGTEAAIAYIYKLLPQIALSGIAKEVPDSIISNIRGDNLPSRALTMKLGLVCEEAPTIDPNKKYGAEKFLYSIDMETLKKIYVSKVPEALSALNNVEKHEQAATQPRKPQSAETQGTSQSITRQYRLRRTANNPIQKPESVSVGGHALRIRRKKQI